MKRILVSISVVIFFAVAGFAQNEASKDVKTEGQPQEEKVNKKAPDILFDKIVHDFGTVSYDGDGTCKFEFKNVGKEPLIISNAKASCGCTVPSWPKEPIGKGESGEIAVKYNTKRVGPFTKTITIYSNAKEPQVRLTIKGTVEKAPESETTKSTVKEPVKTMPVNDPVGPVTGTEKRVEHK